MTSLTRIASFEINHDALLPGLYVSRIDGDITTYDLRCRKPNAGDYLSNATMHSVEHLMATYLRNGAMKESIIYFGPMGCQTGFYLLVRDETQERVVAELKVALKQVLTHTGLVPGASSRECGHYENLDLDLAKTECKSYLECISKLTHLQPYPA